MSMKKLPSVANSTIIIFAVGVCTRVAASIYILTTFYRPEMLFIGNEPSHGVGIARAPDSRRRRVELVARLPSIFGRAREEFGLYGAGGRNDFPSPRQQRDNHKRKRRHIADRQGEYRYGIEDLGREQGPEHK